LGAMFVLSERKDEKVLTDRCEFHL
jgi:hypothetical protein